VPVVISPLQIAYFHHRFVKCLLSSAFYKVLLSTALCKEPIVISAFQIALSSALLQSACFHQCFAKCLLSSEFYKAPTVNSTL